MNHGVAAEMFNVTAFANDTFIETLVGVALAGRISAVLNLSWNTMDFAEGNYTISACATPVEGESNTTDNSLTNGFVYVGVSGDVNGDGIVNMTDIEGLCSCYARKPTDPAWNQKADLNDDGKVNMREIGLTCNNFGRTVP